MLFRKKPPAKRTRVPKRRPRRRTNTRMTASNVRRIALGAVQKGREIKRTWGSIQTDEVSNQVGVPTGSMVPSFNFSEGNDYYTETCLNATRQGLESEMRIGNAIQPISFNMKGYGVIPNNISSGGIDQNQYQSHVRLVVGFRRQNTTLTTGNTKLMLEAGKMVPLSDTYADILRTFNWKEFRPFYDKVFKIAPMSTSSSAWTNPYTKNYFHFNVNYKFPTNGKNLETFESSDGTNINIYNNRNIFAMILVRQMNNDNDSVTAYPIELFSTCSLAFHDA